MSCEFKEWWMEHLEEIHRPKEFNKARQPNTLKDLKTSQTQESKVMSNQVELASKVTSAKAISEDKVTSAKVTSEDKAASVKHKVGINLEIKAFTFKAKVYTTVELELHFPPA